MGMPALSPTMESGNIAKWNVAEGDSFAAGDSLAEIETDKATVDFEAQDDGFVAKILVEANSGDVAVNAPILVAVEEEEDAAAFVDYVAEAASEPEPAPEPEKAAPEPEPVIASTPEPAVATAPPTLAPPTPTPAVTLETAPPTPSPAGAMTPAWGKLATTSSPIAKLLAASQKKYVETYGSTGQVPLRA